MHFKNIVFFSFNDINESDNLKRHNTNCQELFIIKNIKN